MTESLPSPEALFVDRAEIGPKVLDHLCNEDPARRVVALHGAPGFGKTTLVEWICQHDRVREHFPDGTLKVRFSDPSSPELLGCVLDCCYQVSGDRPPYTTIPQAGEHLGKLLDGQRKLIFLDAVWHASDLDPFLGGGNQCARVITTRNLAALPPDTIRIRVDKMTRDEARKLLTYGLNSDDEAHFGPLLDQADGWPLLLSLLNGMMRQEIDDHESSLEEAAAFVRSWLEAGFTNNEEKITTAVEASLERLKGFAGHATLVRFRQLGIFPEGIDIPVAHVLPYLWAPLSDVEIHHELAKFTQLSLVEKFDVPKGTIRLHKVIRDYLRKHNEAQLPLWNQHLLDAYRRTLPAGQAWYALAPEPKYPWQNLAFHLREAGLGAELVAAVRDLRYLSKRAFRYGPAAADSDLRHAQVCSPSDESVLALQAVFRSAPGRLSDFRREDDMAATLAVQLRDVDSLVGAVTQLLPTIEPPYHRVEWMVGDKPQAILGRHDDQPVNAVASDALGTRAASGGADNLVRLWDTAAGPANALLATLGGHTAPVNSLSFDGTGTRVASAAADGTVRVWQVAPGEPCLLATLEGHSAEVNAASFDGSGTRLASAAADGTVRIWTSLDADPPSSTVLAGTHQFVNAVSFDARGTCLAMGAANGVLSVWSLEGEEPSELWTKSAHSAPINAVTV
ncbi:MAG: hypothetical protein LC808_08890, partial [Actinobacteria bacterium]|nr:hypothetical protein [Actinomycetota bacterium]